MDVLELTVTPVPFEGDAGFQVEIFVNGVEMTGAGAGLGMDPYDLLVPTNRLEPGPGPTTVPVARCGCGIYGCGSTDVTLSQEADVVGWSWRGERPMDRDATFDAADYVREVRRAGSDFSWETPERTAGRLVLSSVDPASLPRGLRFDWVANDWRRPAVFRVCLAQGDDYQVFVDVEWLDRTPEAVATEVRHLLVDTPPRDWPASWLANRFAEKPPALAGPGWRPAQF